MSKSITHKFKQGLVLIFVVVIAAILFAEPAAAQSNHRNKSRMTKHVSSKSNSNKACYLLYKKRTESRNRSVITAASRRKKYQPMAETDAPTLASMD